MNLIRKKKIVVLGLLSKMPVGGVIWQTAHYLVGLERLGYEAYYVEAHARTPTMLIHDEADDGSEKAAALIGAVMERFGLRDRWAFHALHADGRVYGMSASGLNGLYRDADLIINLHGGTKPLQEHAATGRLIFLETDPVQLQVELAQDNAETAALLEPHRAFFTFGENYGRPSCGLPISDRFQFKPTRQPVVLDWWETSEDIGGRALFTTVGNWLQPWRDVNYGGQTYSWSKHVEFAKFLDLPRRTTQRFELALSQCDDATRGMLRDRGWGVRNALDFSLDADAYRDYVAGSRGEFTVAKDQNVRLRTGWFSDRSATYLAAGRPVVTQETGFSELFPAGEGLFGFSTMEEAVGAVESVNADYARHSRAAREVARTCFSHDVVLPTLLKEVGL